jgi:outer membrane murein-binding lipoprotein Lpp
MLSGHFASSLPFQQLPRASGQLRTDLLPAMFSFLGWRNRERTSKRGEELVMYRLRSLFFVTFGVALFSGCGSAKVQELTAEVEGLKTRLTQVEAEKANLQAEKAKLEAELATAQKEQQRVAEIKKGYEEAREKFTSQLKALAPLVGDMPSPLPPFEGLADSSWVGKLAPGAKLAPDVKELENALKGLMGNQGAKPAP